uniref:Uncharacterized protein n=1 Tax=Cucumis melo TaxID=3656 RepID=A0A9I9DCC5_CUCME
MWNHFLSYQENFHVTPKFFYVDEEEEDAGWATENGSGIRGAGLTVRAEMTRLAARAEGTRLMAQAEGERGSGTTSFSLAQPIVRRSPAAAPLTVYSSKPHHLPKPWRHEP